MTTDNQPVPDYDRLHRLDGKAFVVLGGGLGIGRQTCHALAASGARVCCVDREVALADEVAGQVGGIGVAADVVDGDQVTAVFARARDELGSVDGVVDIVGMASWGALADIDRPAWDAQFDICLRHAVLAMQIGSKAMTNGGAMAFVASTSGLYGAPMHAAYGAAKAALVSLVRTAAVEFAPMGIRVNAVAPGQTATPRALSRMTDKTIAEKEEIIPLGRLGTPADIAAALLFLVSPMAAQVTGQTLVVDGGVSAKNPYRSERNAERTA